eukprot:CAMPEP_0196220984 /NCGR_PEP_ID=MMETSP0912-20130531/41803_1 /TAXON_ID=49265 /ORGANISM="Thalassiosira rotula, Strain GSO102" /LENGTH=49 /DNA_ID=CAMNT_0041499361 /DNA_START=105 /DNA_END=254 /DNA_ORIENTATION=-
MDRVDFVCRMMIDVPDIHRLMVVLIRDGGKYWYIENKPLRIMIMTMTVE